MPAHTLREPVANHHTGLLAKPDCPICRGSNLLILDALQVNAAQKRWQWCGEHLGPGANYCPCSFPTPAEI